MSAFQLIDGNNVNVSMSPDFARVIGEVLKQHGDNPAVFAFAMQIITDANEVSPQKPLRPIQDGHQLQRHRH